jgi:hypothetical protein
VQNDFRAALHGGDAWLAHCQRIANALPNMATMKYAVSLW